MTAGLVAVAVGRASKGRAPKVKLFGAFVLASFQVEAAQWRPGRVSRAAEQAAQLRALIGWPQKKRPRNPDGLRGRVFRSKDDARLDLVGGFFHLLGIRFERFGFGFVALLFGQIGFGFGQFGLFVENFAFGFDNVFRLLFFGALTCGEGKREGGDGGGCNDLFHRL